MAVAFDAKGTAFEAVATTSFTNATLTIGGISNGALVLVIQFGAAITSPVVKWDSTGTFQTMTLISSKACSDNTGFAYLFGLLAPHTGNKTLSVSWTGSSDYAGEIVSFSGADQTAFATTFKNVVTDATTLAVAGNYPASGFGITTISGDMVVGSFATGNGHFTNTGGLGTDIETMNTGVSGAGRYLAAAGTTTTIAANGDTASHPYCAVGCAIAAVGNITAQKIFAPRLRQYLRR